jgi:hypothetical protein
MQMKKHFSKAYLMHVKPLATAHPFLHIRLYEHFSLSWSQEITLEVSPRILDTSCVLTGRYNAHYLQETLPMATVS